MKKWLKKGSAMLLTFAMVLSLFPGMNGTLATVQAAEMLSSKLEAPVPCNLNGLKLVA